MMFSSPIWYKQIVQFAFSRELDRQLSACVAAEVIDEHHICRAFKLSRLVDLYLIRFYLIY